MKTKLIAILLSVFVIFTFLGCPNLEKLLTATPPQNVQIQDVFSDGVIITWDYEYGMQSYIVYVSRTNSISDASPISVGMTDGAQISGLEPFTEYYFWVTSVIFAGESDPSEMVSQKTLVGSPEKVEISFDNSDLLLTWDSVPNATDYLILYGNKPSVDDSKEKNYTPSSLNEKTITYTLSGVASKDGVYYVWVYARNNESPSSYAATTSKRKGTPNYKFFIDEAPTSSEKNYSLDEYADGTEVFMLKINDSKNVVAKEKTGGVQNSVDNTNKIYPSFSVVGSRISRTNEITSALQEDANVIRLDHKLSKQFDYKPQQFANSVKARSESSVQNRSSYKEYSLNDTRTFYVDDANGNFSKKSAKLIAEGEYSYIWILNDVYLENSESKTDNKISLEQARIVANKFDELYGAETTIFGQTYKSYYKSLNYDEKEDFSESGFVKPEEKISILICDIFGDYSPIQNSGVLGYFWAKDFFDYDTLYEESSGSMCSNETEIFYIDSHFLDSYTEMTYSTLAHEFQHMLNFVNKNLWYNLGSEDKPAPSTWYNEMLSMVCEDLLQDIIGIEDKDSPRSRLSSFNYGYILNGANEWFDDDNVLYSYAHAYAFGAFLARNYGGAEFIKAMVENECVDFESISEAVEKMTGSDISFDVLLQEFARSLCYPEGFEGTEDDEESPLGKANSRGLKHFYKGNSSTIDGYEYTLRPIRLADYHFGYYDENNKVQYKYGPYYLDADKLYDLRPFGISVHTLDVQSGEVTFDYTKPSSSYVDVYFVIQ